jgi:histidinol-phosphate phosphatase family protein
MKNKAVFLDRDGTVSFDVPYCSKAEDFKLLSTVPEAIKLLNENGFKVIVITNQSGVARGYFTEEALAQVHKKMEADLEKQGAIIDAIYYCPHHPDDKCDCRKPQITLLQRAVKEHDIDISFSSMVGDMQLDIDAGKKLGCKTVLISTDILNRQPTDNPPDFYAINLLEAAQWISRNTNERTK